MIQVEQVVPEQYSKLYADYLTRVASLKKVETIMWVVLDYGHEIAMIEKHRLNGLVLKLLGSEDERVRMMAVEAMSRTLGEWRSR